MARPLSYPALLASAILILLAGCSAPKGEFPSLSKRPYETAEPVTEPAINSEPLASALPSDLDSRVRTLVARHEKADAAYRALLPSARQAARASTGAATGSESWANAHMQLSKLDAARADSMAVLGEFDALITAQMEKGANRGIIDLLNNIQSRIAADTTAQSAEIDTLLRQIS